MTSALNRCIFGRPSWLRVYIFFSIFYKTDTWIWHLFSCKIKMECSRIFYRLNTDTKDAHDHGNAAYAIENSHLLFRVVQINLLLDNILCREEIISWGFSTRIIFANLTLRRIHIYIYWKYTIVLHIYCNSSIWNKSLGWFNRVIQRDTIVKNAGKIDEMQAIKSDKIWKQLPTHLY